LRKQDDPSNVHQSVVRQNSEEDDNMMMKRDAYPSPIYAERHLADSIVYLCALLADRPRLIDRYIDYFGETPHCAGDADTGPHANRLPRERREVPLGRRSG